MLKGVLQVYCLSRERPSLASQRESQGGCGQHSSLLQVGEGLAVYIIVHMFWDTITCKWASLLFEFLEGTLYISSGVCAWHIFIQTSCIFSTIMIMNGSETSLATGQA